MNAPVPDRKVAQRQAVDSSRIVASAVAKLTPQALPAAVREAGLRFLLDTFGVMAAARAAPGLDLLNRRLSRWEREGTATGLLGKYRYSPPTAAMANGSAGHALDFDDQHDPARVHTNCVVVPTLLAVAEDMRGVSGEDFLLAWAIGAELHARLGLACFNSLGKGWHPTMVHGCMAAAAAAAKMAGLPEEGIANAIGIAFHQAAGSHQAARDGVLTKRIGAGFAARNAVTSALLAADGVTGTTQTFDGNAGFFSLYERDEVDRSILLDKIGEQWRVLDYSVKPYPCCRCNHTLIGLGIDLFKRGIRVDRIAAIEAGMSHVNWLTVGAPFDPARDEAAHCQFNGAYSLACAIADGEVTLGHYRRPAITAQAYASLAARIKVVSDAAIEPTAVEPAWIKVTLVDGDTITVRKNTIKGSPAEPLTDDEVRAKFYTCMTEAAGAARADADQLAACVLNIAASRDAARDIVEAFPDIPRY